MQPSASIGNTKVVQRAATALKRGEGRLDPVPHERVAQMIGQAILGSFVCLVGLGIMYAAGRVILKADDVHTLPLVLLLIGLAVFFVGATFISKKLLGSLLNVVNVGKTVWATTHPEKG